MSEVLLEYRNFGNLGFGLGARRCYYDQLIQNGQDGQTASGADVQFVEALTENYLGLPGLGLGKPFENLKRLRERFPVVLHGVSLSIGGTDPFPKDYLDRWATLIEVIQPEWVSDHFTWGSVGGKSAHDLLPLPYTRAMIDHLVERIDFVQNYLKRNLVLENVSSYAEFSSNEMPEWEFIREVTRRTDCRLLLDVNNVFVSSFNHGFKAEQFIDAIPSDSVVQYHIAGHTDKGHYLIDTHDEPIRDAVVRLFQYTWKKIGPRAAMIERDNNFPEWTVLMDELRMLKNAVLKSRLT